MKVKALLKKSVAWIAFALTFALTYCGSLVLLAQFMYNDWRILFIAFFIALFVACFVEGAIDGE